MRYRGGPELSEDIQLGNLLLNSLDDDGTLWVVHEVEGWWNLPEPEMPDYPFPTGDGSYEAQGRYRSRLINLVGSFVPATEEDLPAARRKLMAAIELCRKSSWFMTHETDYTVGSVVTLSAQPGIQTVDKQGRTLFSIGLKAADPVKYALNGRTPPGTWSETFPLGLGHEITNEGDYPVYPVISISNAFSPDSYISNATTGETLTMRQATQAGDTLVVDSKMRSVTLNGLRNKRFYLDWATDWITLAPGTNVIGIIPYAGSVDTEVTFTYRHGWIG